MASARADDERKIAMVKYFSATTLIGFCGGVGAGACCTMILWLNPERALELQTLMDLLAGFPVLLARRWKVWQPLCEILFFIYWGLNGAALAGAVHRVVRPNKS